MKNQRFQKKNLLNFPNIVFPSIVFLVKNILLKFDCMNFDKKLSCTFGMIQNGQIIHLNHLVANNIFYILVLVYRIIFFTDSNNKIV